MISYARITKACKSKPYKIVARGSDRALIMAAVNQGIDSHLEGCYVTGRDTYEWKRDKIAGIELHCSISPESLPVLLRRLANTCDEAHLLASDILSSLKIKGDPFDIVSPVDEEAHA